MHILFSCTIKRLNVRFTVDGRKREKGALVHPLSRALISAFIDNIVLNTGG